MSKVEIAKHSGNIHYIKLKLMFDFSKIKLKTQKNDFESLTMLAFKNEIKGNKGDFYNFLYVIGTLASVRFSVNLVALSLSNLNDLKV